MKRIFMMSLLVNLLLLVLLESFQLKMFVASQCDLPVTVTANPSSMFGKSVSLDGSNAAVGAYKDLTGERGSVTVFTEGAPGVWTETAKLAASNGIDFDWFGFDVCIDGSNVVVGARGWSGPVGSAYIFSEVSMGVWNETQILIPSDEESREYFGSKVLLKDNVAFIAAPGSELAVQDAGAVYVYTETSPSIWLETARLEASDGETFAWLGVDIALSGTNLMVGSAETDTGYAYLFVQGTAGSWNEAQKLAPSDGTSNAYFGFTLALEGITALVGAYRQNSDTGAVYVFSEVTPGTWAETEILTPADAEEGMLFGYAVTLSGNLAIGAAYFICSGCAYLFAETSPGTWVETSLLPANNELGEPVYGASASVVLQGNTALLGSEALGVAYFVYVDDVDDCPVENPCLHGGACVDFVYDYCCDCPPAYGGALCTDCLCENGGVCQDDPDTGIGYCDCTPTNWHGNTCSKSFCNNGFGLAYPESGCNCTESGATGKFCHDDIDDCLSSPCENAGTCSDFGSDLFPNHAHEFNCSCDGTGYHGVTCEISDCVSSPCLNDGMCEQVYELDGPIGIQCNCSDTGYEGKFCQTEVDECTSSPCLNDGDCTDLLGVFSCECTGTGYEGLTCSIDIDDCLSSPCENNGACNDKGANKFKCTCNEFWEGDTCTDNVDDCILKGYYCENGAACTDDPVNMGDVVCDCSTGTGGFAGKYCNVPVEDACVTFNPCLHGGKCTLDDITNEMSCDCADTGYEGDVCDVQVYISECVSSPCLNEGQCYDPSEYQDDWYCVCTAAFSGDFCDIAACDSNPCQNGGSCTNDDTGGYTCTCPEGYSDAQCQVSDSDQANLDSSSSSSSAVTGGSGDERQSGSAENDDSGVLLIVIIVAVLAVIGVVGGVLYLRSRQSKKSFMMPT